MNCSSCLFSGLDADIASALEVSEGRAVRKGCSRRYTVVYVVGFCTDEVAATSRFGFDLMSS